MDRKTELIFLSKQDIDSIITYKDVVAAVEQAFIADGNGEMIIPVKDVMMIGEEDRKNFIFALAGYLGDIDVAGVKWTNFYPFQTENIPPIWAHLLVLSHGKNGQPFAVMDSTTITNMRTSGGHAVVAAKYLAKKNAKSLSIMGMGAQGQSAILSFDEHFDLDIIRIIDSNEERMDWIIDNYSSKIKAKIVKAKSYQDLVSGCDILLSATTCRTPLIKAEWIEKGCLVDAMFAFNDIDPTITSTCDKWVLGHKDSDRVEILEHRSFGHLLKASDVYGTLGEIATGKLPGRETDDEIIVFSHMGMGSLDIAVGNKMVKLANEKNIGQTLRLI